MKGQKLKAVGRKRGDRKGNRKTGTNARIGEDRYRCMGMNKTKWEMYGHERPERSVRTWNESVRGTDK